MCGIVGVIAKRPSVGLYQLHADIFEELLYADALRGMDSTGVFSVTKKNQINIVKQAVNPGVFLATQSFRGFKSEIASKAQIVIGHNRKATWGDISSKNAHPFLDKNIVLVHNGYIQNHKELDQTVDVDSQSIITALDQEKEPTKALEKLLGAYAIVWYNRKTEKLYLARNIERPLYIIHGQDHLYLASEAPMLKWILDRNKLSFPEPQMLEPNKVYEIAFNNFHIKESAYEKPPFRQGAIQTSCDIWDDWPHHSLEKETDEQAMTELGRAKAMAEKEAANQDIEGKVAAMKKLYPGDCTVLFRPTGSLQHGEGTLKYVQVWGKMWLPGKPIYKAMLNIPKEKDDEIYMDVRYPLLATAKCVWRKGEDVGFILDKLREGPEPVKDINGTIISMFEWQHICETLGCDDCAKPLKSHQPEFSSVVRTSDGYHTICADCMQKKTTPNEHPEGYSG